MDLSRLQPFAMKYRAGGGEEMFMSFETASQARLAGFLRLHLPDAPTRVKMPTELMRCAIIRELHVYGPSLPVGDASDGEAQHRGIGRQLLAAAVDEARLAGFKRLAVIASIGTRQYYRQHGFEDGDLYMARAL